MVRRDSRSDDAGRVAARGLIAKARGLCPGLSCYRQTMDDYVTAISGVVGAAYLLLSAIAAIPGDAPWQQALRRWVADVRGPGR